MSNHTHLMASLRASTRKSRAAKAADCPHRRLTKDQLWTRLQAAEAALKEAARKAQTCATEAHDLAQEVTGCARRVLLHMRDRAYEIRDAGQSYVPVQS